MPYYKFDKNDIFYNRIESHPKCEFWMYNGSVTYNNRPHLTGGLNLPTVVKYEGLPLHPGIPQGPANPHVTIQGDITLSDNGEGIIIHDGTTLIVEDGVIVTVDLSDGLYPINQVPNGNISLYELNVDRDQRMNDNLLKLNLEPTNLIYPFVTKAGSLTSFKTISTSEFNNDFIYGDTLTGSYPLAAGITKDRYASGTERKYIKALKNTLNYYTNLSHHYAYSSASLTYIDDDSPLVNWSKETQELGLVSIPSIFYGSSIEKGTVDLRFYITGTMIGRLRDENRTGELVQVEPIGSTNSGSVAGVVLYNEGFIILTGSWDLRGSTGVSYPGSTTTSDYIADSSDKKTSQWIYFAQSISSSVEASIPEVSFFMAFSGTNYTPAITMLTHANKGELNYSNNPTFIQHGQSLVPTTSSGMYKEKTDIAPKNTISSSFCGYNSPYKKQTFISKIGVYDEDKNLVGIAKLATPVRKLEDDDYTFKLKLDI